MLNIWSSFPFVRYVLFLVLGVLLADFLVFSVVEAVLLFAVLLAINLLLFFLLKNRLIWCMPALGLFLILLAGFIRGKQYDGRYQEDHLLQLPQDVAYDYYKINVLENAEEKANSYKASCQLLAVYVKDKKFDCRARVDVYFSREGLPEAPMYGDTYVVKGRLKEVQAPLNPYEFDYKSFLAQQNIFHQGYARKGDFCFLENEPQNVLEYYAQQVRKANLTLIDRSMDNEAAAVVKALVLGYKNDLDDDTEAAYSTAGVLHVLAVSGLHVGIIYALLYFFLRGLLNNARYKWLGFFLIVACLWFYALLTGLSPSVLRAVTLFTAIGFAQNMRRYSNIYNTLALSAFLLIIQDPFIFKTVGFQLSYSAVIGIIYFFPKISMLYRGKNKVLQKAWSIVAVSIAAQITTLPLTLYYFKQFPVFFMLSNLIAIPVASFILYGGVALLVLGYMEPLRMLLGFLLEKLIFFFNWLIFIIEKLPFNKLIIAISIWDAILVFLLVFFVSALFHAKKFKWVIAVFVCSLFLIGSQFLTIQEQKQQEMLVVYHIQGKSAIHFIHGKNDFFWPADSLKDNRSHFSVKNNVLYAGLHEQMSFSISEPKFAELDFCTLFIWNGRKVAVVDKALNGSGLQNPLVVDDVIVQNNSVKDIKQLMLFFRFNKVVVDGSNSFSQEKQLKKQAEENGISCHVTATDGAFILKTKK